MSKFLNVFHSETLFPDDSVKKDEILLFEIKNKEKWEILYILCSA